MSEATALSPVGIDHVILATPRWFQHLQLLAVYRIRYDMCNVIDDKSGRQYALLVKKKKLWCYNPLLQFRPTSHPFSGTYMHKGLP